MKVGWRVARLGDLCRVVGGGTPPKNRSEFYSGDIPWATVRDMRSDVITNTEHKITRAAVAASTTNVIPSGNVVVATRVGLGKVCRVGQDTAINQDLRGIVPNNPAVLSVPFLFWWLKSVADLIVAEGTGATVQGVRLPFLKALQVPLPPLADQIRIVAILDEVSESIATAHANTEQNLRNAGDLFDAFLHRAFAQRSPGWVEKPLAECLNLITYGFTNPMPTTAEGPYMITARNVVGGRIDFAAARHTSRDAFDRLLTDKSRPQVGDVLLTKDGTLGRVAVVDRSDVCINQSVALLRPNERMKPHFLRYLLSSSAYQRRMVEAAGGTTIKHIYITRVDKMGVVFPPSTQEQEEIVRELDSLSAETQRLAPLFQQKLAALGELKQSLFSQVFAGVL